MSRFFALYLFAALLVGAPCVSAAGGGSGWKSSSDIGLCQHLFRPSRREVARQDQQDPLLLWLGRPSQALQVEGKHGPLPMPSVWVSFVNILYITDCVEWSGEFLTQFLQLWFAQSDNARMIDRGLYIAGNLEDEQGGKYLFEVASIIHETFKLAGIVAANSRHTPVMRFTAHRSFETNNNMTDWTVNRARQHITCNGFYSEVEFLMQDVHLHYRPKAPSPASADRRHAHFEYELVVASTPDMCYSNMDVFEAEWSTRQLPRGTSTHPRLQNTVPKTSDNNDFTSELFPMCGNQCSRSGDRSTTSGLSSETCDDNDLEPILPGWLTHLLESNVTIVLYNYLQKSSQAICNFYIGIYESDSSKFHINVNGKKQYADKVGRMLEQYNQATLEEMSAVWTSGATSGATLAWLQDGLEAKLLSATVTDAYSVQEEAQKVQEWEWEGDTSANSIPSSSISRSSGQDKGGLVWMQLDDRYVPDTSQGNSRRPLFGYLTKSTAVEILAHVLGKHHPSDGEGGGNVIDFVDLLV